MGEGRGLRGAKGMGPRTGVDGPESMILPGDGSTICVRGREGGISRGSNQGIDQGIGP